MRRSIRVKLNTESIDAAIGEIRAYQRDLKRKEEEIRKKVAERIKWSAAEGFSGVTYDEVVASRPKGYTPTYSVTVDVEENGNVTVVFAEGDAAVFIEFGAGKHFNGNVGGSPHPKGAELGFTIGGYGYGFGARDAWRFTDGEFGVITHGTPAAMPMYNGFLQAKQELVAIAREVFGN